MFDGKMGKWENGKMGKGGKEERGKRDLGDAPNGIEA
jgi:hypothetical protein